MKTCVVCGTRFEARPGKSNRYCGLPCYRVAQKRGDYRGRRGRRVPCATCGKPHRPTGARKRDGAPADRHFCSRACYLAAHAARHDWTCKGCGKREPRTGWAARNRKYCSQECRIAHRRPAPKTCRVCGVLFTPIQIRRTGHVVFKGDRTCCSEECFVRWAQEDEERKKKIGDAFTGDRHPNWMGGRDAVNDRAHRGRGWTQIAEKIRKRDGYRCRRCGITQEEYGQKLHVHHVVPFSNFATAREANRPDNLTTLCRPCHTRAEWATDARQVTLPLRIE